MAGEAAGAPRVVLVGAGGIGCGAAQVLARSQRPLEVVVVDDDVIEVGNLHRQVLHAEADRGHPKAESLVRAIARIADSARSGASTRLVTARAVCERIKRDDARARVRGAAVVIDGSDNFATRFLINDACVLERVPLVHAAAIRWQGQILVSGARGGPCYRCLFEEPPRFGDGISCAEAGVAGPVVGVVGALAAEAALALLDELAASATDGREPLSADGRDHRGEREPDPQLGRLVVFDGLSGTTRTVRFRKNPACLACGARPIADLLAVEDYEVPPC